MIMSHLVAFLGVCRLRKGQIAQRNHHHSMKHAAPWQPLRTHCLSSAMNMAMNGHTHANHNNFTNGHISANQSRVTSSNAGSNRNYTVLDRLKLFVDIDLRVTTAEPYYHELVRIAGPEGYIHEGVWDAAIHYAHSRLWPVQDEVNILFRRLQELSTGQVDIAALWPRNMMGGLTGVNTVYLDDVFWFSLLNENDRRARLACLALERHFKEIARDNITVALNRRLTEIRLASQSVGGI